ncbi:MAG: penicillin-binding protein 1A [Gammaproteobacteria bacterium]|jgi:penicillin-binding protein 1A|nr:penicillin-binding protein 1A [Gammaproteobacteria bacterium]
MKLYQKILYWGAAAAATTMLIGLLAGASAYFYLEPGLPDVESLREIRLQVPLRIYTRDGRLVAEFGEKRRIPANYEEIPPRMIEAFLAAEDDRFYEHPGVDYQGLMRAAFFLAVTGERRQGGGTITMQLARNFFLTPEKTYIRKLREIFLALRIEGELSKREILTLYLNKIFLGQRAYGVAAAAEVFYGKNLGELTLAEIATIAGLPTAPSRNNPITSPSGAERRKEYVLRRMLELSYISRDDYEQAMSEHPRAELHGASIEADAPYVAEMVRSDMLSLYGRDAYTEGYKVTTTLDSRLQGAANRALRQGLLEYDRRHGYRGPVARTSISLEHPDEELERLLDPYRNAASLTAGVVIRLEEKAAEVYLRGGGRVMLGWPGLSWARPFITEDSMGPSPESAAEILAVGDVVMLMEMADGSWQLGQLPEAQASLVAIDPRDGAISALVGGYDYYQSKYNRATQARRQPGSSFKPFIYSAALENGFTAASIINDAPVVFQDATLEGAWRPENYSGRFYGPTRLREALVRSRNMVSIRLLRSVGVSKALRHIESFGFDRSELPKDLSLALGSANLTPLQMARGYTVLASGGYLTESYYTERVELTNGEIVFEADPLIVCHNCDQPAALPEPAAQEPTGNEQEQATTLDGNDFGLFPQAAANQPADGGTSRPGELETACVLPEQVNSGLIHAAPRTVGPQNVYLIYDMMRSVVQRGTGARAYRELKRQDIAGKTGTTNDRRDAWFSGFNADLVTTVWVGFDQERSLGRKEEGGRTALPIWIYFMREALADTQEHPLEAPTGLVTVRIDPLTGKLAAAGDRDAIFETFREDMLPARSSGKSPEQTDPFEQSEGEEEKPDDTLF